MSEFCPLSSLLCLMGVMSLYVFYMSVLSLVHNHYFICFSADTMTVQDPIEMNVCAALWTVVAYTVADLEDMLPR